MSETQIVISEDMKLKSIELIQICLKNDCRGFGYIVKGSNIGLKKNLKVTFNMEVIDDN